MRQLLLLVAAGAALAVPSTALANASKADQTPPGVFVPGWYGSSQGHGTVTTQYRAFYTDFAGPVECSGVNQVNKNTSIYGQDSFTCTSTVGGLSYTPTVGEIFPWTSDYWQLRGAFIPGGATVTAVGYDSTGTIPLSYSIIAYY
jgi:hypothetical protein